MGVESCHLGALNYDLIKKHREAETRVIFTKPRKSYTSQLGRLSGSWSERIGCCMNLRFLTAMPRRIMDS